MANQSSQEVYIQDVRVSLTPESTIDKIMDIRLESDNPVAGIVDVLSVVIVAQCNEPDLQVYGLDGELITKVDVPGLENPYPGLVCVPHWNRNGPAMAVSTSADVSTSSDVETSADVEADLEEERCSDIRLVAGDIGSQSLHFITLDSEDWTMKDHRARYLDFKPLSLSVDETTSELVVLEHGSLSLHTFTSAGEQLHTLQLDSQLFVTPECAVKLGSRFMVADSGAKQVVCLDGECNVQKIYKGTTQRPLQRPWHMAVHNESGHVMVLDQWTHSVQEVDKEGHWVRTVVDRKDGIICPFRTHLSANGLLFVACEYDDFYNENIYIRIMAPSK